MSAALAINFVGVLPARVLLADGGTDNALAALDTRYGGRLLAGMLQANCSAATLSTALAIKFGGGLPAVRLLADGGADNTFGGPRHQDWWRTP